MNTLRGLPTWPVLWENHRRFALMLGLALLLHLVLLLLPRLQNDHVPEYALTLEFGMSESAPDQTSAAPAAPMPTPPKPTQPKPVVQTQPKDEAPAPIQTEAVAQPDSKPAPQDLSEWIAQARNIDAAEAAVETHSRHKTITTSTREPDYARYMEAWRQKVERVGNLNYPHGLSGSLLLDVALYPDGNIESIDLRRSSGTPALDRAAIEIVKLAAPVAPVPERITAETDILHIVRTWQFGGRMK
jgi:protein TonB